MIPLGDGGGNGPAFGSAAARIGTRLTQLLGFTIAGYGTMWLYAGVENSSRLTARYDLTLGAMTVRVTEHGFLGGVSVEHQLLGGGLALIGIGALVVLATTRGTAAAYYS